METKKEFETGLHKSYLRSKKIDHAMTSVMRAIQAPFAVGIGAYLIFTSQPYSTIELIIVWVVLTLLLSTCVMILLQPVLLTYFFFFPTNIAKERMRLRCSIEEKKTALLLSSPESIRKINRLHRHIWEMEFDLKTIGGSVSE